MRKDTLVMHIEQPVRRLLARPQLGRVCHVIRVGATDQFTVAIASIVAEWFVGHWNGRKTVRCLEDRKQCKGCLEEWPERAKGYITVCSTRDYTPLLLELTPGAGEDLDLQFPFSESLRGAMIHVQRVRPKLNAPLKITRVGKCPELKRLPESVDPTPTVNRLWPEKMV